MSHHKDEFKNRRISDCPELEGTLWDHQIPEHPQELGHCCVQRWLLALCEAKSIFSGLWGAVGKAGEI